MKERCPLCGRATGNEVNACSRCQRRRLRDIESRRRIQVGGTSLTPQEEERYIANKASSGWSLSDYTGGTRGGKRVVDPVPNGDPTPSQERAIRIMEDATS